MKRKASGNRRFDDEGSDDGFATGCHLPKAATALQARGWMRNSEAGKEMLYTSRQLQN